MIANALFYRAEYETFRGQLQRFTAREIAPHAKAWDEAGEIPRELYRKAAEIGALCVRVPEAYGGIPADRFFSIYSSTGTGTRWFGWYDGRLVEPYDLDAYLGRSRICRVRAARAGTGTCGRGYRSAGLH